MDPGHCVEEVVRSIALQSSQGASISQVWAYTRRAANQDVSEFLKELVWKWISRHPDIVVRSHPHDGHVLGADVELSVLIAKYPQLRLYANETRQWRELADRTPGSIGNYPWDVLCAVARAGSAGMSAVDIRKETGQDARSLHGRILLLVELGLVNRYPTVVNSANTSLVVFAQFDKHENEKAVVSSDGWNPEQVSKRLVELCKSGPDGIRLSQDLVDELGFKKVHRGLPLFRAMIKRLVAAGSIRRVDMYEASDPSALYRCIQYIKDLPGQLDTDLLDEEKDDEEDDDDLARPGTDVRNMILADATSPELISANLYYSLASQVYDLVAKAGTAGLPAMDIYRNVAGQQFTKVMGRILDTLSLPKNHKGPYGHLGLVRAVDFEGRTKFYRYFTRPVFAKRTGEPFQKEWGKFSSATSNSKKSIATLENAAHGPLPGYTGIVDEDGRIFAHFHGDSYRPYDSNVIASTEPVGSRGRPRKSGSPTKKPSSSRSQYTATVVGDRVWKGGVPAGSGHMAKILVVPETEISGPEKTKSAPTKTKGRPKTKEAATEPVAEKPESTEVRSLAREKRREWVLDLLKEHGGLLEGGFHLQRLIDERSSQETQIDRRTVDGVINALLATATVKQYIVGVPGSSNRKLIVLQNAGVSDEAIEDAKAKICENAVQKKPTQMAAAPTLVGEIELVSNNARPRRYKVLEMEADSSRKQRKKQGPSASDVMGTSAAALTEPPKKRGRRKMPKHLATVDETPEPQRVEVDPRLMLPRSLSQLPPMPAETPIPPELLRNDTSPPKRKSKRRAAEEDENLVRLDGEHLMKLVVVSRELYGRGTAIDWDMVVSDLPGVSATLAKRKWPTVREGFGGTKRLATLGEQFAKIFEAAYARGDVTREDPHSHDFSLGRYVEWWTANATNPHYNDDEERLSTRDAYESKHGPVKSARRPLDPLENAQSMPSMIKLEELMLATPFGVGPARPEASSFTAADMRMRAVIAADQDTYNASEAAAELKSIPEKEAAASIEHLQALKAISSLQRNPERAVPGRLYSLSDKAQSLITSKLLLKTPPESTELAKSWFTNDFKIIPATVNESLLIPLFEGATRLASLELKRVANKAGRLSTHYRSRMISKDMLDGEVEVRVRPGMAEAIAIPKRPQVAIPQSSLDCPYIWQTTRLSSKTIWSLLVLKVVTTILFRPGITEQVLEHHLKLALAPAEVGALVSWLTERGNIVSSSGLFASPQWYVDLY